jgi:hypothetical protein
MRHDHDQSGILPTIEMLESRRLMSTSVFLGGECLPHVPTPTPSPTPSPTPGDGNGQGDDNDQGDHHHPDPNPTPDPKPTPNPTPTPPPVSVVIPEVIGNWSGSHSSSDKSVQGSLSLDVTEPTDGDLAAHVDFTGPQRIRWSGQLLYNAQTGHFTMFYLSSKLVAKFDATLGLDNGTPTLQGTVEYFTAQGSYKSTFLMLHDAAALP